MDTRAVIVTCSGDKMRSQYVHSFGSPENLGKAINHCIARDGWDAAKKSFFAPKNGWYRVDPIESVTDEVKGGLETAPGYGTCFLSFSEAPQVTMYDNDTRVESDTDIDYVYFLQDPQNVVIFRAGNHGDFTRYHDDVAPR